MDEKTSPSTTTNVERTPEVEVSASGSKPVSVATGWEARQKAMARKKVSTTVYIEPEQAEQLKLLHERTKVPVAVYIREGIELVLAKYQHMLPGQLPLDVKR